MRLLEELPGLAPVGGEATLTPGAVSKKPKGREDDDAAVYNERVPEGAPLVVAPVAGVVDKHEAELERTREEADGEEGDEDDAAARGRESVGGNRLWIFICVDTRRSRRRGRCRLGRGLW